MLTPPFRTLEQVKEAAAALPLEGLVLILTRPEEEAFLAVYLEEYLPQNAPSPWLFKPLSALSEEDLLIYDGLSIGYDALDSALPNFRTHGIWFYDIRRLFAALDHSEVNATNSRNLATWLATNAPLSPRREEKMLGLMLPSWQQHLPPDHEILALACRRQDFPDYLSGQDRPQWLDVNALILLDASDASSLWVFAFPEAQSLLPPGIDCKDWRPLLLQNGYQDVYQKGLKALARALWRKGQQENREALQIDAWELALERWLPNWAGPDVVAVRPTAEFEAFLEEGRARILTRTPVMAIYHPERVPWGDFLDGRAQPDDYTSLWFALSPALERIQSLVEVPIRPLEPLWLRSGANASLAQALLGMAEDLREGEMGKNWPLPRRELVWLALRGLFLIGLGNPWETAWGGRYGVALDAAYRLLDDVLLLAEQQSTPQEQPLFSLLRRWYGGYHRTNGALARYWADLQKTAQAAKNVLSKPTGAQAEPLLNAILTLSGVPNLPILYDSDLKIESFWKKSFGEPVLPLVFGGFLSAVENWQEVHDRTRVWEDAQEKPTLAGIDHALKEYRRLLLGLHALPHEQFLLKSVVEQEQKKLERLRAAMAGKVVLQIRLLTEPLPYGRWTTLMAEIRNIGEVSAENLEIVLSSERPDALEVEKEVCLFGTLPSRSEWQRVTWQVQAKEEPGNLVFTCNFQEGAQNHSEEFLLPVTVLRPIGTGQRPRGGNRFQAGVSVSGEKFFGRHRELKTIFDTLLGDAVQPVLLRGPRRIGKTSILNQIKHLLEQAGELQRLFGYTPEEEARIRRYRPVWISLQRVESEKDIPGWYFGLYRLMAEAAGESMPPDMPPAFEQDPYSRFEALLKELLSRFPEIHWLILLDEWDAQRHVQELGGKLRALMQNQEFGRIQWVFSSTWMLSEEAGRFGSPFYGQIQPIELTAMSWEDARQMVLTVSREMGVEWEGDALLRLLDQTALRPYLIQRIGHDVIEYLSNSQPPSSLVTVDILDAVLNQFIHAQNDPTSPFTFLWPVRSLPGKSSLPPEQLATLSWLGRMILLILEEADRPLQAIDVFRSLRERFGERGWEIPYEDFVDEVVENLTQLEKIFDALKVVERHYEFSIPLARAWFRNAIQNTDDPWQAAWERLQREQSVKRRANKERK